MFKVWPIHPMQQFETLGEEIAALEGILAAERQRGLAGHWTYELPRHRALLAVYRDLKARQEKRDAA